ncbi:hypothetical protein Tco_0466562 [Tanacetum coccineum]
MKAVQSSSHVSIVPSLRKDWKDKKKQKRSKTNKKREKDKESRARVRIQPEITAGSARHRNKESQESNYKPKLSSVQRLEAYFEVLKIQGLNLPKE